MHRRRWLIPEGIGPFAWESQVTLPPTVASMFDPLAFCYARVRDRDCGRIRRLMQPKLSALTGVSGMDLSD